MWRGQVARPAWRVAWRVGGPAGWPAQGGQTGLAGWPWGVTVSVSGICMCAPHLRNSRLALPFGQLCASRPAGCRAARLANDCTYDVPNGVPGAHPCDDQGTR